MARALDNASVQYLGAVPTPVTTTPMSMACWFMSDNSGLSQFLMQATEYSLPRHQYRMYLAGHIAGDPLRAYEYDGDGAWADTTTGYSVNIWQHACAIFAAANSRAIYIDGGSKGTNNGAQVTNASTRLALGANWRDAGSQDSLSGAVAEAAIWNVPLLDYEVLRLANRWSPLFVRPQNLVAYYPLWGYEDETIVYGRYKMVPYNSPTIVAHPFIRMPPVGDPLWNYVKPQYRPFRWWPIHTEAAAVAAKTSYVSII